MRTANRHWFLTNNVSLITVGEHPAAGKRSVKRERLQLEQRVFHSIKTANRYILVAAAIAWVGKFEYN